MSQIKNKTTLNLILLFSIFALSAAYFIQHILDHKPCNLCLIERLPYIFAIIIIISLGLILKKFEKTIIILLILIFITATIISFYHFGIEQGFFKESLVCNLDSSIANLSKEDLIKELQQQTVSCKDVSFRIFGLSLATINTIISLILSVITIKLFLNYGKNK
jgi:disulfide bond formation protein DsbB